VRPYIKKPSSSILYYLSWASGVIVGNYDRKFLYPMPLKCHYHLQTLVEFLNDFVNQKINEDYNLDSFLQISSTIELTKKIVNIILLTFKQYQTNVKDIVKEITKVVTRRKEINGGTYVLNIFWFQI